MNRDPLFDKILSLWTNLEVKILIKHFDILEEPLDPENLFTCLKVKMTKGHQSASVIDCSFIIFDGPKFIEQFLHQLIVTFLRYIVDKHFLPDFVFGSHFVTIKITWHSERVDGDVAAAREHGSHGDWVQH